MKRYNPKEIEPKWQKIWQETGVYTVDHDSDKPKSYIMNMFPYPSGNLHIGHWYAFAVPDVVARFSKMNGKEVLHPFGFDSFGLPAENAAIKNGIPPAKWTNSNMASMTKQLNTMGNMYPSRETVTSSDPSYYKWTQWMFLKLLENGLAYRKGGLQNWCPKDQTVLANEQVIGDEGLCDRCDTPVVQKELEQWFFKITDYADELLDNLDDLDWPEKVKLMQRNWIGRSEGINIDYEIVDSDLRVTCFTTTPVNYGMTFIVVAPEHDIVDKITTPEQKEAVDKYVADCVSKTAVDRMQDAKEKTGVFTGSYALNQVTGEKVPIWIADFVLANVGTGAVQGCPAHDERDFEFAKNFNIPIIRVVEGKNGESERLVDPSTEEVDQVKIGKGIKRKMVNSEQFDGLTFDEAMGETMDYFEMQGWGKREINYKLRDWLISRQRYWGAPIPIIYCDDCGVVPVPEANLPVKLPDDVEFDPAGKSPLQTLESFMNVDCPKCSKPAKRDTDTMDTFVDSSWYFLRYPNPDYEDGPFDPEAVKKWLPVDHYIGGVEHAILHLLYARFITKALRDHNDLGFGEPFTKLTNQGMILGPNGLKMSKSKGNVVDPDEQAASYGADSLRLYMMFMGPYDQGGPYDLSGITGTRRFIERVWALVNDFIDDDTAVADNETFDDAQINFAINKTIKKVTLDLQENGFNTAIAAMMEFVNTANKILEKHNYGQAKEQWRLALNSLVKLLAPLAPHVSEEMWHLMGNEESVHIQDWPVYDEAILQTATVNIVVQVNGKVRANLQAVKDASKDELIELAKKEDNVASHIEDKEIKKTIVVPNKIVSFVV